jgi:hypothetical protein
MVRADRPVGQVLEGFSALGFANKGTAHDASSALLEACS